MSQGSPELLLDIRKLFCERDERVLFEDLSFSVASGDILQIEGANGAGKTTLLKILSGLAPVQSGEVLWRHKPVQDVRPQFLESIMYLGHKTGVKSSLTPFENLSSWCALRGDVLNTADDKLKKSLIGALESVGLGGYEHVPCNSLSAGQSRRVALARLYLSKVPLWILDEAFTAIDLKGVKQLESLFVRRAEEGGAVILTTHHAMALPCNFRKIRLGVH